MIPETGDAYLDLANTYLLIRAKVVRGVGTDLAADTPVAPVNNWLHYLFSQVNVYLNDTLVTPSSNTYPFRAYVDTVLSYGAEAKNTQLTSQLWYKDTAGHMDATTVDGGNTGLIERRRHIAESRIFEMMGGGGYTSTSSSKTDFFPTVSVSRYGSYVAKTSSR